MDPLAVTHHDLFAVLRPVRNDWSFVSQNFISVAIKRARPENATVSYDQAQSPPYWLKMDDDHKICQITRKGEVFIIFIKKRID